MFLYETAADPDGRAGAGCLEPRCGSGQAQEIGVRPARRGDHHHHQGDSSGGAGGTARGTDGGLRREPGWYPHSGTTVARQTGRCAGAVEIQGGKALLDTRWAGTSRSNSVAVGAVEDGVGEPIHLLGEQSNGLRSLIVRFDDPQQQLFRMVHALFRSGGLPLQHFDALRVRHVLSVTRLSDNQNGLRKMANDPTPRFNVMTAGPQPVLF